MKKPRTFWAKVKRFFEPPRRLRPTRIGFFFMLGVIGIGTAAVNTGNNLLYFILGMFLSAIVVSGILSERNLRGLLIDRATAATATAGEPAAIAYLLSRDAERRGIAPAFALSLRDRNPESGELFEEVRIGRVDSGSQRRRLYTRVFAKRGVHAIEEIELATIFPFGLFRKSRRLEVVSQVRVRPRVPELTLTDAIGGREDGVSSTLSRGDGLDLFGLRDHVEGDDARRIHWKASARTGRVIVKDPAREEPPQVVVRLVLEGYADDAAFERAVERAAGAAAALLRDGFGVGLIAGQVWIAPSAQPAAREAILDALVDVTRDANGGPEAEIPRGAGVLVVGPADALATPQGVAA